ncbi:glycosyl hydrolase family 18 protein [Streptomyces endophytica]|uniref:Glycosyl hydrolase family 18 protein n=1 Tax=Streptomyces endophytica TaxID=2991496 RepID=A0ABY6PH78_9ACTN|nr:glycosyl hydrolase family 18 protein [Streptomyces endophytica]UZJ33240.1 glycosyl hydrolase family 18 protein [Streptomyces endophytica]
MDHVSGNRARGWLALLLAAVTLTGPLTPAAAATPDTTEARRRTVSAWLPYWGDTDAAYRDALRHASQLHTVSPFWYQASDDTTLTGHHGAGRRRIIDGLHRAGIKVVPTVTETLGADRMAALLHDPERRRAHLDTLLDLVASRSYDGIDLDYEAMAVTGDRHARDRVRTGYRTLVRELCTRLHDRDKECVVTVLARARGTGTAFDYAHLGRSADRIRIMGYDLHWSGGDAGPLSSTDWYDEFLRYATDTIPPHKIEVAFPGYGWDWVTGTTGHAAHLTWKEAEALRAREGADYLFDVASGTPHFTYRKDGEEHQVWYQDARGVRAHLPLLRAYGVRNTGLWALGFEDPDVWAALRGE